MKKMALHDVRLQYGTDFLADAPSGPVLHADARTPAMADKVGFSWYWICFETHWDTPTGADLDQPMRHFVAFTGRVKPFTIGRAQKTDQTQQIYKGNRAARFQIKNGG